MNSQENVSQFNWRLLRFFLWAILMATSLIVTGYFDLRRAMLVPMVFLPLMVPMVLLPLKRRKKTSDGV